MKIIIFGGTKEAIELANLFGDGNHDVLYSLAGRTDNPRVPNNAKVRFGGFGGVENLSKYFTDENFDLIIDATHPYAKNISNQLVKAAKNANKELVRFNRPSWEKEANKNWIEFDNFALAIKQLPTGAIAFISTGHKGLKNILSRPDVTFFVRLIEKPKITLPNNCSLIISRPPYVYENEFSFFKKNKITHLIAKNSGSLQTRAKIDAAIKLDIDIFMIARPDLEKAKEFASIKEVAQFLIMLSPIQSDGDKQSGK